MLPTLHAVLTPHGIIPPLVGIVNDYAKQCLIVVALVNNKSETELYDRATNTWCVLPVETPSILGSRLLQSFDNGHGLHLFTFNSESAFACVTQYTFDMLGWKYKFVYDFNKTVIPITVDDKRYFYSLYTNKVTLRPIAAIPREGTTSCDKLLLRHYANILVVGDYLYVIGGTYSDSFAKRDRVKVEGDLQCWTHRLSTCQELKTGTSRETRLTPLPHRMASMSSCVFNSMIVVGGGEEGVDMKRTSMKVPPKAKPIWCHPILPTGAPDPKGTWDSKLIAPICDATGIMLVVCNGELYTIGPSTARYDAVERIWVALPSIVEEANYIAATI
jgi:hypothetical protein